MLPVFRKKEIIEYPILEQQLKKCQNENYHVWVWLAGSGPLALNIEKTDNGLVISKPSKEWLRSYKYMEKDCQGIPVFDRKPTDENK